jgi:hypothetical protein
MKTAIVILADPNNGNDESLGRLFNALAVAHDCKQKGDDVTLLFQGAGTRWVSALDNPQHPAHGLWTAVQDKVAGVSCACAEVFHADTAGTNLLKDNPLPGTSGVASLPNLVSQGYSVLTF